MAKRKNDDEMLEEAVSDYGDILDTVWEDVPEDKLLPPGTWLLKGRRAAYVPPKDETNGKVLFFYIPQEPNKGVDPAALEDLGPDYDITENQIVYTIWVEFNRDWSKVRRHLALHGIEDPKMSLKDSLKAVKNTEVLAHIDVRTYVNRNGESVTENTATNFAALESF